MEPLDRPIGRVVLAVWLPAGDKITALY